MRFGIFWLYLLYKRRIMRNIIGLFLFLIVVSSCSKVTEKRLQGTWKATEIKEIPAGVLNVWNDWLDTTVVKVGFLENGIEKSFYFEADSLVGYSEGKYELLEDEEKLIITTHMAIRLMSHCLNEINW
jgi:hypothetical protein